MSKSSHSIAIIEPSHIVYEGLVAILLNSGIHYHVSRLESIEELASFTKEFDILLINPLYIQQNQIQFEQIIVNKEIYTVAIVYALFPNQILKLCNSVIHITDTPEYICSIIEKDCKEHHSYAYEKDKEILSEREIQVLKELVKGYSNKEIADSLCISIHTVISHRKNIVQKTGIKSQAGLTIYALSNNIIALESIQ
ncbi:MAG TPA: helix-turn-helix transcriptional regulator [Bacteroidales bacterium]|jgi:DNA-binding CsgD family transcriptional regulator|nr:helix-turn-helix transcriptional regulator [Bacteroidales bacterium]HRS18043.1 helix-turn-helix transcriptional regulator [Bacteroidales bacterium]